MTTENVPPTGAECNITPFLFEGEGLVRAEMRDDKPLFVANDVAAILGYSRPDNAIARHCKHATTYPLVSGGQVRHVKMIPESDVFRLIVKSQLPSAERFERWLFEEVLPALRRTGSYTMPGDRSKDDLPPPPPAGTGRSKFTQEEWRTYIGVLKEYRFMFGVAGEQWMATYLEMPIPPAEILDAAVRQLNFLKELDQSTRPVAAAPPPSKLNGNGAHPPGNA